MAVLQVDGLTKVFPEKRNIWGAVTRQGCTAVSDVSFSIHEGEILGLLGPNGSGKTTIIHMLLSTLTPTSGSISYFGKNLLTDRSAILQHVGFASTYVKLPPRLTIIDNLDVYGRLYGLSHARRIEKIEHYLRFFGMWHLRTKEVGVLSAGEATRVMLAKAFLADPKIVLLDEPTASLDPDVAYDIRRFVLQQQKEYGVSFLITSHNMHEVSQVCERVMFLKKGTIIAHNTPEFLARSIARARIQLQLGDDRERVIAYARELELAYTVHEHTITIELEEHAIAEFLTVLARMGIGYSHIAIQKPTLEDYFVHLIKLEDSHGILPGVGNNTPPPASHNS